MLYFAARRPAYTSIILFQKLTWNVRIWSAMMTMANVLTKMTGHIANVMTISLATAAAVRNPNGNSN